MKHMIYKKRREKMRMIRKMKNGMKKEIKNEMGNVSGNRMRMKITELALHREEGLDGILVTIGLCIIALLLCVVMRDSLTGFIQTIVSAMTDSAKNILNTPAGTCFPVIRFL